MKASTHLMFQGDAAAAIELYASVFPDFAVAQTERFDGDETPDWIKRADIRFAGHSLIIIDSPSPHDFDFIPSSSIFVDFDTADDLDGAFTGLAKKGEVRMPLDDYGFSRKFGWLSDRFGVSWQLNLPND